ncbi:hypothetical protein ES702_06125 [subsurface metagenome]
MSKGRVIKQCRVQFTISTTYSHLLSQILEILGSNQAEFVKAITYREIDKLAEELLGIKPGGPEADYHRLYGYWLIRRGLKANPYRHQTDISITQTALSKYGEENIRIAMCRYGRILYNQEKYAWCEVQHFEDWLSDDIKYFLPDADPSPFKRFARPNMDITDIDVVQNALDVELWG